MTARRLEPGTQIRGAQRIVELFRARFLDHRGAEVDAVQSACPIADGLAHQSRAAAEIENRTTPTASGADHFRKPAQDGRRAVVQFAEHARLVIRRELIEEMSHVAGVAAWRGEDPFRGDYARRNLRRRGFTRDRSPRFQRLLGFAGIQPCQPEPKARGVEIGIETQGALELADRRRKMSAGPKGVTQAKRSRRNIGMGQRRLARHGKRGRRVAGGGKRLLQRQPQQKSAAPGVQISRKQP